MTHSENVEIVIRSAMSTFPDRNIQCSPEWTILQLKEHLKEILSFKPEIARQRLIYAGHCLENTKTIRTVLAGHAENSGLTESPNVQVFHLVYSQDEALRNSFSTGIAGASIPGLRHRQNINSNSTSQQSSPAAQNEPNVMGFYASNFAQNSQNPYDYYAAYYQNYMNHLSMALQQQQQYFMGGAAGGLPLQPSAMGAFTIPQVGNFFAGSAPIAVLPAQAAPAAGNQFFGAFVPNFGAAGAANFAPNPAIFAAAAMAPGQAGVGGGAPGALNQVARGVPVDDGAAAAANAGLDILDVIYKTIRFLLLLLVIYAYSSFERLFAVVISMGLFWFARMQRARRNRNLLAGGQPNPNNNNPNQLPNNANNNNNNNNNNVGEPDQQQNGPMNVGEHPPTVNENTVNTNVTHVPVTNRWAIFWSTISSFFTSLIPENPMPLN